VLAKLPDALGFCAVRGLADDPETINYNKFKVSAHGPSLGQRAAALL
jgi:hypothetical protein